MAKWRKNWKTDTQKNNSIAWLLWILSYDPRQKQPNWQVLHPFSSFRYKRNPIKSRNSTNHSRFLEVSRGFKKKTARIQLGAIVFNVVPKLQEPFSQIATIIRQKSAACLWAQSQVTRIFMSSKSLLMAGPSLHCHMEFGKTKKKKKLTKTIQDLNRWIQSLIKFHFNKKNLLLIKLLHPYFPAIDSTNSCHASKPDFTSMGRITWSNGFVSFVVS